MSEKPDFRLPWRVSASCHESIINSDGRCVAIFGLLDAAHTAFIVSAVNATMQASSPGPAEIAKEFKEGIVHEPDSMPVGEADRQNLYDNHTGLYQRWVNRVVPPPPPPPDEQAAARQRRANEIMLEIGRLQAHLAVLEARLASLR